MEPADLERSYNYYINDLSNHVPDGIVEVNLALLQEFGLLTYNQGSSEEISDSFSHNFFVIESPDKLTLFNDKFSIWIVPKMMNGAPTTYTLIALNEENQPHLEIVFTASGVYNHSGLVLRILEKFLQQIEENEEEICRLKED
ncbi:MAG: hypothetical protein R3E91_04410 [Chlamydiales bacterium]